jgi:hypothetical protein
MKNGSLIGDMFLAKRRLVRDGKEKAKVMHSTIEKVASQKGYLLKLRK